MRVDVVTDGRGRRVVEKRADGPVEAARLQREADVLNVAGHPGLVELVTFVDGPEPCLSTARVEGATLAELAEQRSLEADEVAGVVASVATTVADLHAVGLVHGAITLEHVILDGEGRPVLCSLGYGGLAGERPSSRPVLSAPFRDPSLDDDGTLHPASDVYGLGAILATLLSQGERGPRSATAAALLALATSAMAVNPDDRPSARELANAVHDAVVGARLPRASAMPAAPTPGTRRAPSGERTLESLRRGQAPSRINLRPPLGRGAMVAGLALTVAVAAGAWLILGVKGSTHDAGPRAPAAGPAAETSAASTTIASTVADDDVQRPPSRPPTASGCPAVDEPLSADIDGDGCAEAVRFADGVVTAGHSRWSVGQAGDLVAVGDWSCRGTPSLAVLRPATGEVFAFAAWAGAGQDVSAPLLAHVGGGRDLLAADLDGDGCHELVVERAIGAPAVLRPARNAP